MKRLWKKAFTASVFSMILERTVFCSAEMTYFGISLIVILRRCLDLYYMN